MLPHRRLTLALDKCLPGRHFPQVWLHPFKMVFVGLQLCGSKQKPPETPLNVMTLVLDKRLPGQYCLQVGPRSSFSTPLESSQSP